MVASDAGAKTTRHSALSLDFAEERLTAAVRVPPVVVRDDLPVPVPENLVGSFVVEVGERQAWPFLGFCDNRKTPATEVRLYIDADCEVVGGDGLADLMSLAVEGAEVADDATLYLQFGEGRSLTVSGTARSDTVGDVWWFGPT